MDKKRLHRVTLVFGLSMTRSVFVKARNRQEAERKALRQNPTAKRIDRSPYPLN